MIVQVGIVVKCSTDLVNSSDDEIARTSDVGSELVVSSALCWNRTVHVALCRLLAVIVHVGIVVKCSTNLVNSSDHEIARTSEVGVDGVTGVLFACSCRLLYGCR